ncbi:MAG: DUF192 domain-containing protein [Candidatus Staskawiczbacteria bacterium]|nr:DUF192 domain-containing protein [Candidatus Staskawiczbacteria bacterium]
MPKNKNLFLGLLIFAVAGVVLICLFFYFTPKLACTKDKCFYVELAKTPAELEKGLMYRAKLEDDKGMLFILGREGVYPFWMKNTLIPLDIIWIGKDKKVVFISKNSQPCGQEVCPQINPGVVASYVLEINAGISERIGLKKGIDMVFYGIIR